MKDVMILSYEGNVRIDDAPSSAKPKDLINIAREVLQEDLNSKFENRAAPLMRLSNVEYLAEKEMHEHINKLEEMGIEEDYILVNWEDYK